MSSRKILLMFILLILLVGIIIISPWIALWGGLGLMPQPPKPKITYGEFNFSLIYEINGKQKNVSDILVCEYDGIKIDEGHGKTRSWKENIKNINGYELFAFRDEERKENNKTYSDICIENIGQYKVILGIAEAEWFLGEPEYKGTPEMPYIQVYDTETKYYKDSEESIEFLSEYGFKVISWTCDEPIKNEFK